MHKFIATNFVLLFLVFVAGIAFMTGCETEKEVVKTVEVIVNDTIVVSIISVDSINADPDSVTEGASLMLSATVNLQEEVGLLTYNWFSTDGLFLGASEGDTVTWKAPDAPGTYMVSVHVTNGEFIAIGSRFVGVGMFVPTTTPYFLGESNCMSCHMDNHDEWSNSAHADAWATLQESGHPQAFCNPCHAVGYDGIPGNAGHDEVPIEGFVDVQCESCHGPASTHTMTQNAADIAVDYSSLQCGSCHDGEHHPYLTQWQASPHGFDPEAQFAASTPSCMGCHEGVAAAIRLSGDVSVFYGSGTVVDRPPVDEVPLEAVACATCHDPHNADNIGQLRTVADIPLVTANGESPVITVGGSGKLCMHCHHARRGPDDQVVNGYAHFGPHANPQADMMLGASAYHGVADPGFPWADPSHLNVQNSCKTCHLNMVEFGGLEPGSAAETGHTFLPTVAACANCHGEIADFDDILALEDFDGDGTVEGVQSEVNGLMAMLEDALVASFTARGVDTTGLGVEGVLGDTMLSTFLEREAGYNWAFVHDDKSDGIHNPDYTVQLLQQSFSHLTGTMVPNAVIVREDNRVVAKW